MKWPWIKPGQLKCLWTHAMTKLTQTIWWCRRQLMLSYIIWLFLLLWSSFVPLTQITVRKFIFNKIWFSLCSQHQITHTYSRTQGETLPCNVLYWDTFWKCCRLLWSPVIEYWGYGVFIRSKYCRARALLGLWAWKGSIRGKSAHATALSAVMTTSRNQALKFTYFPFKSCHQEISAVRNSHTKERTSTPVQNWLHYTMLKRSRWDWLAQKHTVGKLNLVLFDK